MNVRFSLKGSLVVLEVLALVASAWLVYHQRSLESTVQFIAVFTRVGRWMVK